MKTLFTKRKKATTKTHQYAISPWIGRYLQMIEHLYNNYKEKQSFLPSGKWE